LDSIRILLVDDHPVVRDGLRAVIERIPGASIVAEAGNGRDALALATEHQPDVVIMDIGMKDLDGIEATLRMKAQWPSIRVLILSGHSDSDHVLRALRAGANGYLLKDWAPGELQAAIEAVSAGDTYLSPQVSRHVVSGLIEKTSADGSPKADLLTPRQSEILKMIAEGKSTKEIAFVLEVSTKTIETHRARIMERLEIHDIAGLVVHAIRTGLIDIGKTTLH
jgi:DNA-binding NarL/FixJ family response regulator